MAKYIKSHSNYVLKKKHQNISDGTIWERDITTIGGINYFAPGQTPIYRDNNFIITIRNDGNVTNQYNQSKWIESSNSGDSKIWTLNDVNSVTSDLKEQDDTKIVIKQDYYDFTDFAYYGSLTELFRSSITDIINRFPGELYGSEDNVYYETTKTIDGESYATTRELGKEIPERDDNGKVTGYTTGETTYYELKNPFGINIHSSKKPVGSNPLKYFAEDGYSAYTINDANITKWTVSKLIDCAVAGELIGTVTINDTYTIYIYAGTGGSIHYMHTDMTGMHITPNEKYLAQFYNECDAFQRLLMNPETTPKYKADFSVIYENEYGYYRRMESFIFPTSDGGYNIDPTAYGFNDYTARFARIGEFYDERFTDNMWRSMTHEAIKNFDWTRTREYVEGDAEEYALGGERIQKALRVFAREFDEVKSYIDNINNVNRVTYDERDNLPNYFLTDTCENDGWDILQVIPYSATSENGIDTFIQDSKRTIKPYGHYDGDTVYIECSNKNTYSYVDTGKTYTYMDVNNEFLRRLKLNSRYIWRHKGTIEGIEMILAMFGLKSKRFNPDNYDYEITEYTRSTSGITDEWNEAHNTYFFDWVNSTKTINYDYRTISIYNPKGNLDASYIPYQGLPVKYIDNGDKTRTLYPNFEKYEQYDGNPYFQMNGGWLSKTVVGQTVSGDNASGDVATYNFQYDNDGQPLFTSGDAPLYKETVRSIRRVKNLGEMLSIPSSQLKDGSVCYVEKVDDNAFVVDGEVFETHEDKSVAYVGYGKKKCYIYYREIPYFGDRFVCEIESTRYPIHYLKDGEETLVTSYDNLTTDSYVNVNGEIIHVTIPRFIILTRSGGLIKVGDKYFDDRITVYSKYGEEYTYTLDDKLDGYEVYAYIILDETTKEYNFICQNGSYSIDLARPITLTGSNYSNYFMLNDIEYSGIIASLSKNAPCDDGDEKCPEFKKGWLRLSKDSCDYKRINTIWNYYKGNNPHNGNLNYDSGEEYYEYFKHLFKHAYENDLFDDRCYDDYYNEIDEAYSGAAFSAITELTADTKIHYFGNYYETSTQYIKVLNGEGEIIKEIYNKENGESFTSTSEVKLYLFNSGETLVEELMEEFPGIEKEAFNLYAESKPKDNSRKTFGNYTIGGGIRGINEVQPYTYGDTVTNHIMNDKRLKISFNMKNNYSTSSSEGDLMGRAELKFIDEIVMNYLTQLVPSTAIFEVEYNFENCGGGLPKDYCGKS